MSEAFDKVTGITELPIFPLALVLFPGVPLPLHIFEPRYRQMIADIKDDDPTVVWSPDGGSRLAIFGVAALFMVDAKGGPTEKLTDQGGYGGLDWAK